MSDINILLDQHINGEPPEKKDSEIIQFSVRGEIFTVTPFEAINLIGEIAATLTAYERTKRC